jgi:hypothetical protein
MSDSKCKNCGHQEFEHQNGHCVRVGGCDCTKYQEKEEDTVAASVVRGCFGDEGADIFKEIFGDWF